MVVWPVLWPSFSGTSLNAVLCCGMHYSVGESNVCIVAQKRKENGDSLVPPLSEKCIHWLFEYWWLLIVPCHLRCCEENPENGKENLLKIESLRKRSCRTGFTSFYSALEWMIDIDFNTSATDRAKNHSLAKLLSNPVHVSLFLLFSSCCLPALWNILVFALCIDNRFLV